MVLVHFFFSHLFSHFFSRKQIIYLLFFSNTKFSLSHYNKTIDIGNEIESVLTFSLKINY